jgi:hypothetical protein
MPFSAPVFNIIQLNVFDLNAAEIFLLEPQGGGGAACIGLFYCFNQGVTKGCRLSWLTNSALVYEPPNAGGGGELRGLSQ